MNLSKPDDAALLAAIIRDAIQDCADALVVSTAELLEVVGPQAPERFSREDIIAAIVEEASISHLAVVFETDQNRNSTNGK